jgi:hypothetical protein
MTIKTTLAACATFAALALTGVTALADDHAFTEGPVVNVARIRTVDGKFDEYMKWIDTTWKQEQELAKKAGDVLSYQVLSVEPRTPEDPDLGGSGWCHCQGRRHRQANRRFRAGGQSIADRSREDPHRARIFDHAAADPEVTHQVVSTTTGRQRLRPPPGGAGFVILGTADKPACLEDGLTALPCVRPSWNDRDLLGQPRGLFFIGATELWERGSLISSWILPTR